MLDTPLGLLHPDVERWLLSPFDLEYGSATLIQISPSYNHIARMKTNMEDQSGPCITNFKQQQSPQNKTCSAPAVSLKKSTTPPPPPYLHLISSIIHNHLIPSFQSINSQRCSRLFLFHSSLHKSIKDTYDMCNKAPNHKRPSTRQQRGRPIDFVKWSVSFGLNIERRSREESVCHPSMLIPGRPSARDFSTDSKYSPIPPY